MEQPPVILAVVGDSAAGKTTLTTGVATILGPSQVVTLRLDDYHRYNRAERERFGLTPLHPDCNYLEMMEDHLFQLSLGRSIIKPVYNHKTGDFDARQRLEAAPFIMTEGLLALATPRLREPCHMRVFLDPPEDLRERWKIRRDSVRRGYTPEQVREEMARRRGDAIEFIQPQRGWADLIVRFFPAEPGAEQLSVRLVLRPTLSYPDLSEVIASQGDPPVMRLRVGRDDGRLTEILEIDGRLSALQAEAVEDVIWEHLPGLSHLRPEQIGTYLDGTDCLQSHVLGLVQLLIAYQLLLKAETLQQS
ncbi:MAG: phosphoribulokinase [Chloroflexia bacterium]|nr:phosphoribulokinase [Chloroflexia bacterium]